MTCSKKDFKATIPTDTKNSSAIFSSSFNSHESTCSSVSSKTAFVRLSHILYPSSQDEFPSTLPVSSSLSSYLIQSLPQKTSTCPKMPGKEKNVPLLSHVTRQLKVTVNRLVILSMILITSTTVTAHSLASNPYSRGCPDGYKKFEILSGYAFSSPADSFASIPGCLELSSCLSSCRSNETCLAVNFETGLCVLLSSSAQHKPQLLKESQFPVFTIYAQKVCISDYGKCSFSRRRKRSTSILTSSPQPSALPLTSSGEGRRAGVSPNQYHSNHQQQSPNHYHNEEPDYQTGMDTTSVTWVYERVPGHQLTLIDSMASGSNSPGGGSTFSSSIFADHHFSHSQPEPWAREAGTVPPTDLPVSLSSSTTRYEMSGLNNGTGDALDEVVTTKNGSSIVDGLDDEGKPLPGVTRRTINEGEEKIIEVRVSSLLRCVEACLQEKSFNCLAANFERTSRKCILLSFDRHSLDFSETFKSSASALTYMGNSNGKSSHNSDSPAPPLNPMRPITPIHSSLYGTPFEEFAGSKKKKISPKGSILGRNSRLKNPILISSPSYDYIEINCKGREDDIESFKHISSIANSKRGQLICDFKPISGLVLKTVDAIYENVHTVAECKQKCMESPFKCRSFDMGEDSSISLHYQGDGDLGDMDGSTTTASSGQPDPYYNDKKKKVSNKKKVNRVKDGKRVSGTGGGGKRAGLRKSVCRLSHLDRASLSHLKEPYTYLPGVTTYEKDTCFSVKVTCGKDHMKAAFDLNKAFTGRVYSMKAPSTCSKVLDSTTNFALNIPFFPSNSKYWDTVASSAHDNFKKSNVDCGVSVSTVTGGKKRSEEETGNRIDNPSVDNQTSANGGHDPRRLDFLTKLKDKREFARFSVSLVVQRHALIVTSSDLDLTLNCDFDLSQQRIVSNSITLVASHPAVPPSPNDDFVIHEQVVPSAVPSNIFSTTVSSTGDKRRPPIASMLPPGGGIPPPTVIAGLGAVSPVSGSSSPAIGSSSLTTHEATFHSPVVKMSITDRSGGPVKAAEVGDPLSLRFEIQSDESGRESLYEIFVKNIVADDGVDTSELELIDSKGCPTDPAIMGPLRRALSNSPSKVYEAPFEAFKFPTSAIVQFRALIVPCIQGDCHPVLCTISSIYSSSSNINGFATFSNGVKTNIYSYGKRRKRRSFEGMKITLRSLIGSPGFNQTNGNQTSDEIDLQSDLPLPLKEVEERVFIEVLEKRVKITSDASSSENETSAQSRSSESGQTTGSFETFSGTDILPLDPMDSFNQVTSGMSIDKLSTGQVQTTSSDFQVTTKKPSKIVTKNRRNNVNYHRHDDLNRTKSRTTSDHRSLPPQSNIGTSGSEKSSSSEEELLVEDCFAIPIPYLITCFLLLVVQLIFLIRYFLTTKTIDARLCNASFSSSSSFRPITSSPYAPSTSRLSSSSYARSLAFSMKLGDN